MEQKSFNEPGFNQAPDYTGSVISKGEAYATSVTDRSYEALEKTLKAYQVKPTMGDPDGGFSNGEQAIGYAIAVKEADLSDEQKLALMNLVYGALVGYNGTAASEVIREYKTEIENRIKAA